MKYYHTTPNTSRYQRVKNDARTSGSHYAYNHHISVDIFSVNLSYLYLSIFMIQKNTTSSFHSLPQKQCSSQKGKRKRKRVKKKYTH